MNNRSSRHEKAQNEKKGQNAQNPVKISVPQRWGTAFPKVGEQRNGVPQGRGTGERCSPRSGNRGTVFPKVGEQGNGVLQCVGALTD